MTIYILLLLLSLILIFVRHNAVCLEFRSIIIFSFLALLFVLEIFRSINVGVDYGMYYGFFTSYDYDEMRTQFIEPAYAYLTNVAQFFNNFYIIPFFVLFIGLIGIICINRQFRLNKYLLLSFFILMGLYFQSFDILRQYIAIGFICIGFATFLSLYKLKDIFIKYIVFILFIYIAFNFHKSAIVGFLFLILTKIKIRPNMVIILGILTFILAINTHAKNLTNKLIAIAPFYSTKYGTNSMASNISATPSLINIVIRIIPIIFQFILLYFFVKRNYCIENYKTKSILSGYIIYLILSILITFWGPGLRRIQLYFIIFPIFYSCMYMDENQLIYVKNSILSRFKIKKYSTSSVISKYLFVLLWVITYITKLLIDSEKIVPYKFI